MIYPNEESGKEQSWKGEPWLGKLKSSKELDVFKELIKIIHTHFKIVGASGEKGSRIELRQVKNGTSRVTEMF